MDVGHHNIKIMLLDDLVNAIFRVEGANNPNSINQKMISQYGLYNPGHLVWANQNGATKVVINGRAWAGWSTPEEATQAVKNQVTLDASRGHTLGTFINKYAPSSENDTTNYINLVSQWLGLDSNTRLDDIVNENSNSNSSNAVFKEKFDFDLSNWDSLNTEADVTSAVAILGMAVLVYLVVG